ncbi:hypothetical protein ACQPW1_29790 [Nocardia sp. CA-128927]|uniref:hypothetical protein n=1 Tax=Nocardia sp. CA-128927 TaxID=3239975 RepID=UPI003D963510
MTGVHRALPSKPLCVGRGNELDTVRVLDDRAATSGAPLLVAISGGSGIGKSTLILTLAYELGDSYPDVLYHALGSAGAYGAPSAADVLADLLVQLGVPWQGLPEPALRLPVFRSMIAKRRLLLILDDIESAGQVLPLLGDVRKAGVIVAGERHFDQLRNEGFQPLRLRGFRQADAVDYLVAMAGSVVGETDPAVLHRLVALCGGVPWMIAAAAARLADGDEPAEDYVARLEQAATEDEISEDLRVDSTSVFDAVCEASYRGLTENEARAYRWLSLLPGPEFDHDAGAAILELPVPRAKRLIRELVERSLVREVDEGRFEYPHVMRRHALGKSREQDRTPTPGMLTERAIQWYTERAVVLANTITARPIAAATPARIFQQNAREDREESAVERAYSEFAARWQSFVAVAWRAVELGLEQAALTLPMAMWPFAYHTARVTDLIDGYRALAEMSVDPAARWAALDDTATRWQLWRDLGALYERSGEQGDLDTAVEYFQRAALVDYPPGRASCLEWQAIVRARQGRAEEALSLVDDAWAAVPLLGDTFQEARSYALLRMHRGRFLIALDRGVAAEPDIIDAERYFDSQPTDVHNAARCRALLGDSAAQRGATAEARGRWEEAVAEFARYGLRAEAAATHDKLAGLAEHEGREVDGRAHREQALRLRIDI